MLDSIKDNGIISPVLVRPKDNGRYELISRHRRKKVSEMLRIDKIPCIIRELTDDEAPIQHPVQDNSNQNNSTPKSNVNNDFYHSITKGKTEYESDSVCYTKGKSIQDKELDSILDWNEQHPEELKQPIINYSKCYEIVKDSKSYWYLHFFTAVGEGMDDKLKNMYN